MKNYEDKTIYSIGEAADFLGVHVDTVRNWEKRGVLQSIKTPGGHRRYAKSTLDNIKKGKSYMDEEITIDIEQANQNEMNRLAGVDEKVILETVKVTKPSPTCRYNEEAEAILGKWNKFGLLNGIDEDFKKRMSVILENQKLFNEMTDDNNTMGQFKRLSIPLVRRIWGDIAMRHFISVQPLLGPHGIIHYFKNNQIIETETYAQTRKMKTIWSFEVQQDLRWASRDGFRFDAEVELAAVMAQELTLEFDREVIHDLEQNAALKKEIDFNHLSGDINERWAAVKEFTVDLALENQEIYHRPFLNWIITSPEMAEIICAEDKDLPQNHGLGVREWGSINTNMGEVKVWGDPLFPTGKILIGYKGDHEWDAGYIHCPYVTVSATPVILDPNTFIPQRGIMCRYAKKLVDSTYYSVLHIKNFKSKKQHEHEEKLKNGE